MVTPDSSWALVIRAPTKSVPDSFCSLIFALDPASLKSLSVSGAFSIWSCLRMISDPIADPGSYSIVPFS